MKITVLGAGAYGSVLADILIHNGHVVNNYDIKLKDTSLGTSLIDAEVILLAVPSKVAPYLLSHLPKNLPLIIATKGFLSVKPFVDFNDYMVISGPGFANDIKAKKETRLTATDQRIIDLFTTDYLTFDYTDDVNGVLMCGALKNVYAILAGWLDLRRNSKEWNKYVNDVSEEMKTILSLNGANPQTVDLACGIGDLKLTCGLPSRNYEFGRRLRSGRAINSGETIEGLVAINRIQRGDIKTSRNLKYLKQIKEIVCR
ncbi:hypothetical protein IJG89_00740 [Candidatus Saccharibacteria bacterium]|nr:hypothetical protein [Candidatus Saccharibacteria bacterium]